MHSMISNLSVVMLNEWKLSEWGVTYLGHAGVMSKYKRKQGHAHVNEERYI